MIYQHTRIYNVSNMKEVVNIMFKSYHFFLLFLYDIIQMSSENYKTVQTPDM